MFDEQTNASAPSASPAPAPSAAPSQPVTEPAEEIRTMPMEYYLGGDTVAATNAGKPAQAGKFSGAEMKAGAATVGAKKKWLNYVLIAVLVVVVGVSGFLLVKSYEKPAAQPAASVPVVVAPTETVTETEPIVESPPPGELVVEEGESIGPKVEPVNKFNPDVISQFTLSLMPSVDTDNDGLTDAEEPLFGTDPNMNDSDGDVYKDAEEVSNMYSPADAGNVRLWQKEDILKYYTNVKYGYKVLYPISWLIQPLNSDDSNDLMIMSNQNEFIDIVVYDKKPAQSVKNWYLEMAPSVGAADLKEYLTLKKYSALESPDGFTVYVENPAKDKVYAINYNIGLKDQAGFPTVFLMAVQSFELIEVGG